MDRLANRKLNLALPLPKRQQMPSRWLGVSRSRLALSSHSTSKKDRVLRPKRRGKARQRIALDACVVRLGQGERVSPELASKLGEIDVGSIHIFALPPDKPAGLHYHDFDEYWLFIEGNTTVSLRSEDGTTKQYQVGPEDLIATPKGVEHGHAPKTPTRYIQFSSKAGPGSRPGHLQRAH